MKTLYFLFSYSDSLWIKEHLRNRKPGEEIAVIAPTFEGKILAEELQIPHHSHEETAWSINKPGLFEKALRQSRLWADLVGPKDLPGFDEIRHFRDFPLLEMIQGNLLLSFYEVLQAYEFMKRVVEMEVPDKVVMSDRENPFEHRSRLFMLTGSNGLEREALRIICCNKNIELRVIPRVEPVLVPQKRDHLKRIGSAINNPVLIVNKMKELAKKAVSPGNSKFISDVSTKDFPGFKKILVFTWGGYYLQQIASVFDTLVASKCQVAVIILGDELTPQESKALHEKGISIFYKPKYKVRFEKLAVKKWKERCEKIAGGLESSMPLTRFFSDEQGYSYYKMAFQAIKREITRTIPLSVIEIMRSEKWIAKFHPDMVLAHFSVSTGACDVLPARMKGIPTLALSNGISLSSNAVRDTFSSNHYAVIGEAYKESIIQTQNCPRDVLFPVGDVRMEKEIMLTESSISKKKFGFDPHKRLCIFTDVSGWSHTLEHRHSTYRTLMEILALKRKIKDLQIVYRVHHGSNYSCMQQYFQKNNLQDVFFQISPKPLFTEIVQAADVVISHHTSAITEALLSGVRVIYLKALSVAEPSYFGYEAIKIADSFEKLPELVEEILREPVSKPDVVKKAQPFFDDILCGNDGNAGKRLAELILKLVNRQGAIKESGFQDWLARIDASCKFERKEERS